MKKLLLSTLCGIAIASIAFAATGQEAKPQQPRNGFELIIENSAEITHDRSVVMLLNAQSDVDRMAISLSEDFSTASLIPYQQVFEYELPEQEGEYTIYVKVYTRYGVASEPFSDTIIYRQKFEAEKLEHRTLNGELLQQGDLFKRGDLTAVYYYGSDNKRYVFPQESVFFSWFDVSDFNRIKTVSSQVLSSIPIGGNIVYRPGSTLVKIVSNDKVYAVGSHGRLYWVHSEQLAREMYGSNWKQKVKDIPDTLFGNYTISTKLTRLQEPPDGFIFSMPETSAVYLVHDETIRPFVSQNALEQNGYSLNQHIPEIDYVPYNEGNAITNQEFQYIDAAQLDR